MTRTSSDTSILSRERLLEHDKQIGDTYEPSGPMVEALEGTLKLDSTEIRKSLISEAANNYQDSHIDNLVSKVEGERKKATMERYAGRIFQYKGDYPKALDYYSKSLRRHSYYITKGYIGEVYYSMAEQEPDLQKKCDLLKLALSSCLEASKNRRCSTNVRATIGDIVVEISDMKRKFGTEIPVLNPAPNSDNESDDDDDDDSEMASA
jgi:tetratricopeptide (TPR) repeat protein